MYYILH
jgi:hypothetical protein